MSFFYISLVINHLHAQHSLNMSSFDVGTFLTFRWVGAAASGKVPKDNEFHEFQISREIWNSWNFGS